MSSPPSPSTSIKAAELHKPARKSLPRPSLPSIPVLDLFRRKTNPNVERSPPPVEPYEVAPGIWNTDATAKVFGYLEPNDHKAKSRSKSVGSNFGFRSQAPRRKPVAQSSTRSSFGNGPPDVGINHPEEYAAGTYAELPGDTQMKRGGEVLLHPQEKTDKARMRTVSRDDQLVHRGANPRTGLVSPFVVSDSSDDNLSRDYVNVVKAELENRPSPKSRSHSGKWKQHGVGWSLVESPSLSPIAQSVATPPSRKVSVQKLEDKLLVQMPGVDNPEPANLTEEQIRKYQESIARAYKRGGSNALIDPDTLPSPRPVTPDGPSTPPNKLQKIRRKMVGSGPNYRGHSNETIVHSSQEQASQVLNTRADLLEKPNVNNDIASNTCEVPPLQKHDSDKTARKGVPFLGQTNTIDHPPSLLIKPPQEVHTQPQSKSESKYREKFVSRQVTPMLSQVLPQVRLLHPSHFTNLETSTYRRPAHLLPERLRPQEQGKPITEDVCITTITSTLNQKQQNKRRPKMQRQSGSNIVPKVNHCPTQKSEIPQENYLQAGTLRKKHSFATRRTVDVSDLSMTGHNDIGGPGQNTISPAVTGAPQQSEFIPQHPQQGIGALNQEAELQAEQGARVAMIENFRSQRLPQVRPRKESGAVSRDQGLRLGSANIVQDHAQRDRGDGAGTILTFDPPGDIDGDNRCKTQAYDAGMQARSEIAINPNISAKTSADGNGNVWFAGQWASDSQYQKDHTDGIPRSSETLSRKRSILQKANDSLLQYGTKARSIQPPTWLHHTEQRLCQMICHVVQTLHPQSEAVMILRSPTLRARDYLGAVKDLILAAGYLLLLINIVLVLRKVIILAGLCLYWIWHPVGMVMTVLRWCLQA
ncbi:hypothetical protein ACLMJK_005079 [Lecanora helva]